MCATLVIFTALRYEALGIARQLGLTLSCGTPAWRSAGAEEAIELRVIGPRGAGLAGLELPPDCRGIVMAGLAGALDPSLSIGDVVVDARSDLAIPPGHWRRGEIHTASELIAVVAEKQSLFRVTGAMVVDMENAVARDFAARHAVPFLGIRAVGDRADEPLDPASLRWIDPAGTVRPARLAADLLRSPAKLPGLWRLGRRSRVAMRHLANAVGQVACAPQPVPSGRPVPCGSTA